jgi:hypothetical protein
LHIFIDAVVNLQSLIFNGEIVGGDGKVPELTELRKRRKPEHHPF